MNIWYISKYAESPVFGQPTRQYFFAKYFAKKGLNVTLINSRSNGNKTIPSFHLKNHCYSYCESVKIITINGTLINLGFNIKRIISWIEFELRLIYWAIFKTKERPDIIIVSSLSLLTVLSGIFFKNYFKCKFIYEVRDIWPLTLIETKNWKRKNILIQLLAYIERHGYKHADKIVGTMGNLKEHIKEISIEHVDKVEYIPTGFDYNFYSEDEEVISKALSNFNKISKDSFIVGYAGSMGVTNCVEQIIEVADKMKCEPVYFILIGDGVLKSILTQKVNDLKLNNILFLGYYPKKNIPFILKRCHILLNPWLSNVNTYKYGLSPNKWIDYMYSGRPIIVSVDGFHNIINEAHCGVFIKAGDIDAMIDAINEYRSLDKDELDRIGNNGKKYLLKNLTYDILSEKYISLINKLKVSI